MTGRVEPSSLTVRTDRHPSLSALQSSHMRHYVKANGPHAKPPVNSMRSSCFVEYICSERRFVSINQSIKQAGLLH